MRNLRDDTMCPLWLVFLLFVCFIWFLLTANFTLHSRTEVNTRTPVHGEHVPFRPRGAVPLRRRRVHPSRRHYRPIARSPPDRSLGRAPPRQARAVLTPLRAMLWQGESVVAQHSLQADERPDCGAGAPTDISRVA